MLESKSAATALAEPIFEFIGANQSAALIIIWVLTPSAEAAPCYFHLRSDSAWQAQKRLADDRPGRTPGLSIVLVPFEEGKKANGLATLSSSLFAILRSASNTQHLLPINILSVFDGLGDRLGVAGAWPRGDQTCGRNDPGMKLINDVYGEHHAMSFGFAYCFFEHAPALDRLEEISKWVDKKITDPDGAKILTGHPEFTHPSAWVSWANELIFIGMK